MKTEIKYLRYRISSPSSYKTGTIEFNFDITDSDVTRLNNSKIIKVVHVEKLQNLTRVDYQVLPFFESSKLYSILDEFLTFKSESN